MKTPLRIDELYAFVASDEEGEGLTAFLTDSGWMPMVAADRTRVDSLWAQAKRIARESGRKITLCRFTVREEIGVIEP